jgi:hypothetical protein
MMHPTIDNEASSETCIYMLSSHKEIGVLRKSIMNYARRFTTKFNE